MALPNFEIFCGFVNKSAKISANIAVFDANFDKSDKKSEICQFCQGFGVKILPGLTKNKSFGNFVKVDRKISLFAR